MPFCPNCGAENEADAAFCESCGAPLGTQPPSLARPPGRQGFPWAILGGIVALVVVVVGGVLLYNALSDDENGKDARPGGQEDRKTVMAPTTTVGPTLEATATLEPPPSPRPSPIEPPPLPTPEPPPIGYDLPTQAITVYLELYGIEYVGDCAQTDLETDVGKYCSMPWEDRGDRQIYVIGLAFSEPDTWLLLAWQDGGGWFVVDSAEFVPGPQDTVPPWP